MPAPKKSAATPARQRAAKPKPRQQKKRAPRAQSAAIPGAPRRPSSQLPPLTQDLIDYFQGDERLQLIVEECVPDDATPSDVLRLLLEARRLGADPLRHDVFLRREGSRDGAGLTYAVAAKRDALVRYANRQPDFLGHDEAPIFKNDTFKRGAPNGDGKTLAERAGITHESGMPGDRGALVGAWCVAEMRGKPPTVRILDAEQYLGTEAERNQRDPEDVKRRYPDACMIAAAMSNALRIACGLNDVVGAEELTVRPPAATEPAAEPAMFADGPRDDLDTRIVRAHQEAQTLDPMLWPPAKIAAHLASARTLGADEGGASFDEARAMLAEEIESDVQRHIAMRRDPTAIAKRLRELRAFDPADLDEEARREYDTELAAILHAADAAELDTSEAAA